MVIWDLDPRPPSLDSPGDSLSIVQGARVPYIFRPCYGEEGNYMKLEGEAYVHNIMHGEAFQTGSIEFQLISIR